MEVLELGYMSLMNLHLVHLKFLFPLELFLKTKYNQEHLIPVPNSIVEFTETRLSPSSGVTSRGHSWASDLKMDIKTTKNNGIVHLMGT